MMLLSLKSVLLLSFSLCVKHVWLMYVTGLHGITVTYWLNTTLLIISIG